MFIHGKTHVPRALVAALAVVSAALMLLLVAAPTANAANFIQHNIGKGHTINASGSSISADGCLHTDWSMFTGTNSDGTGFVSYTRSIFDGCYGELTYVTGTSHTGLVEASALTSARVVATIALADGRTGAPAGEVSINNTFTGFGPAETGRTAFQELTDQHMFQYTSAGQWKQATSTGTVHFDFAQISKSAGHQILIIFNV